MCALSSLRFEIAMSSKKTTDASILATLLLIFLICAVFLAASLEINRKATNACFGTLDDVTAQVAADLRASVSGDREQLEVIADLLAQHDTMDSDIVRRHLSSFQQRGTISSVGLLLPDGRLILGSGVEAEADSTLDYADELQRAPYISGAITAADGSDRAFYCQAVPVRRDGETLGILYGFVNLSDLARELTVTAFDGNVQIYVADGETGDFLIDTWHDTLGNIFDSELMSRKTKRGYDFLQMKQDFVQGRSGRIAFRSNTAGEYFYSSYMPVGVSRWMVQLTVPEGAVFANVIYIRHILYGVALFEALAFAAYLLGVISRVRRDTAQKSQRLAQSMYMYSVQQTLFDAYKSPELFTAALQKVADMLTADRAFFVAMEGEAIHECFFFPTKAQDESDALVPHLASAKERLSSGRSLLLYPEDIAASMEESECAGLMHRGIGSLMLSPVLNSDGALAGILGCANMKRRYADCILLECVSRNFLMALSNRRFYDQIEQASITDALTGLRNRNCYERFLEHLPSPAPACCLYIDANGLHELNNTLGHAAGDAMLTCIGSALTALFPPEGCYRIGGDEFVVLCPDCGEDALRLCIAQLRQRVEEAGYRISVGEAWLKDCAGVQEMIVSAEKRMYEAKHQYYQEAQGSQRRVRGGRPAF